MAQEDYFAKTQQRQQNERRSVQAEHLRACTEKWQQDPCPANLKLMQHILERIQQDESMVSPREWNLKQASEE